MVCRNWFGSWYARIRLLRIHILYTLHCTERTLHTQYFLACGPRTLCGTLCVHFKNCSSFSCVMSHSHSLWSDFPPFLLLSTFPLYCILLTVMNNHSIHGQKNGLVDWPYKSLLQIMSPTPLLRSAVRRLLSSSYHQWEQVSVQRTILVRTSQLRLCLRKSMRGVERLASPLLMQKREASAAPARTHHSNDIRSTPPLIRIWRPFGALVDHSTVCFTEFGTKSKTCAGFYTLMVELCFLFLFSKISLWRRNFYVKLISPSKRRET